MDAQQALEQIGVADIDRAPMPTFPYPALELTSGTLVTIVAHEDAICARVDDGTLAIIKDLVQLTVDTPEWVLGARREAVRDFMAWKQAQVDAANFADEYETRQDVIYGGCQ